ncbi:MAG: transporter [Bacteroidetes bacterium CG12_big_fil_rev_8_21_14_0_65_60_17]|nr:MAG: transporter [Bacteroidetes bacterium CG12_big_fil_rev_8_21_14_0_65_60_17]
MIPFRPARAVQCALSAAVAVLLVGVLAGLRPVMAQPSSDTLTISIHDAIRAALSVSPEVATEQAGVDFAKARHNLAKSSRILTNFEATSAHSATPGLDNPNNTPTDRLYLDPDVRNDWENLNLFNRLEVEALQPIWTWGELGGNIRAARAGIDVERAVREQKELEVASRTAELYWSLLLTEELFRLTGEAGDVVAQAKNEIDRLLQEGAEDVDMADLYQVQITEQEFMQRVVEAREARRTARSALRRQLFLPDNQTVAVAEVQLKPISAPVEPLEAYQQRALDNRPELARARAGERATDALVDVARSDFFPKLFFGVTARYGYAADRHRQRNPFVGDPFLTQSVETGLGLRLKLNAAQTRSRVQQAQARHDEVRYQHDAARQLVLFEVEKAWRDVLIARQAVTSREEALKISRQWLLDEQINFDLDLGDTENLVKAVRDNLTLRAQRHEAVFNYNMTVLRLYEKTGTLLELVESGTLLDAE